MGRLELIAILVIISVLAIMAKDQEKKEYEGSDGNGKCDTDLDCDNHGRCVNENDKTEEKKDGEDDKSEAKCICDKGRDGKNCDKVDKASRRYSIFGQKKNQMRGGKRQLMPERDLPSCLDPIEVVETKRPFVLYNPRTLRYVRVSRDSPSKGEEKGNNYLVADKDIKGESKLFKLKKSGTDEYNIIAMDNDGLNEVGFLYVSDITKGVFTKSNRVMKSAKIATGKENAYKFKFIRSDEQNGVYKIKCRDLTLYASTGAHNIKADNRGEREKSEEIWFQLSFRKNLDDKVEVVTEATRKNAFTDPGEILNVFNHELPNNNDKEAKMTLNKEVMRTDMISKMDKYAISGTGGLTIKALKLGVTASKEKTTTKQFTISNKDNNSIEVTVAANSKLCIKYQFELKTSYDEEKLKITLKGGKIITGYRLIRKDAEGRIEAKMDSVALSAKCD